MKLIENCLELLCIRESNGNFVEDNDLLLAPLSLLIEAVSNFIECIELLSIGNSFSVFVKKELKEQQREANSFARNAAPRICTYSSPQTHADVNIRVVRIILHFQRHVSLGVVFSSSNNNDFNLTNKTHKHIKGYQIAKENSINGFVTRMLKQMQCHVIRQTFAGQGSKPNHQPNDCPGRAVNSQHAKYATKILCDDEGRRSIAVHTCISWHVCTKTTLTGKPQPTCLSETVVKKR
uniref:Uncharacterized protein n=1 Tax=Glossina austeni TaxID=7395 RepID=A0A1A9VFX4_GLOAU